MGIMMSWIIVLMMGGLLWIGVGLLAGLYIARMLYPSTEGDTERAPSESADAAGMALGKVGG